jgi:hypothetical protein
MIKLILIIWLYDNIDVVIWQKIPLMSSVWMIHSPFHLESPSGWITTLIGVSEWMFTSSFTFGFTIWFYDNIEVTIWLNGDLMLSPDQIITWMLSSG